MTWCCRCLWRTRILRRCLPSPIRTVMESSPTQSLRWPWPGPWPMTMINKWRFWQPGDGEPSPTPWGAQASHIWYRDGAPGLDKTNHVWCTIYLACSLDFRSSPHPRPPRAPSQTTHRHCCRRPSRPCRPLAGGHKPPFPHRWCWGCWWW